jgi:hypothetical protein
MPNDGFGSKAALQRSGLALAATDDVSTGPLVRSSEAVKYQVAGSMQIRYVCARNQSKYFTVLPNKLRTDQPLVQLPDGLSTVATSLHPPRGQTLGHGAPALAPRGRRTLIFARYAHLQPGSLQVKTGDPVRRGQVIARIGDSGDARGPHLHFQVTTASSLFVAGEGVPYLIEQHRVQLADGTAQTRTRELPLGGMLIDFGSATKPR